MQRIFLSSIAAPAAIGPCAKKAPVAGILALAVGLSATPMPTSGAGNAQDARSEIDGGI